MKFTLNSWPDCLVIALEEEKVDSSCSPKLKSELIAQRSKGVRSLVLDLSKVKYIDSSGLSALLVGNRIFQEGGGIFVLASPSAHVTKLIRISQLQNMINSAQTVQEAVEFVRSHQVAEQAGDGR